MKIIDLVNRLEALEKIAGKERGWGGVTNIQAIDQIRKIMEYDIDNGIRGSRDREALQMAIEALEGRPDIVKGFWDNALDFSNGNEDIECSVCGEWFNSNSIDCDWNYCPNCGAKMEV